MQYTLKLEIQKSLSEVAALFGDKENLAKWQPGYLGEEEIDGKTALQYQKGKKIINMFEEIEVERMPEEFTAIYRFDGMEMRVQNLFQKVGENQTKWITHNTFQSSGVLGILMWFMRGCAKRESLTFMENFKAFAETGKGIND